MSKKEWVTITEPWKPEKITYKFEKHSPVKSKSFPWMYCKYCGLVYLKNRFTKWAIKTGCLNEYHIDYKRMRKHFTSV